MRKVYSVESVNNFAKEALGNGYKKHVIGKDTVESFVLEAPNSCYYNFLFEETYQSEYGVAYTMRKMMKIPETLRKKMDKPQEAKELSLEERQKAEAIRRMKALHVYGDAIRQFRDQGKVMVSEPPFGGLYWLNEKEQEMVDKFEKENGAIVYMVVRQKFEFGMCDALLFVGKYEDEWEAETEDIKEGIVFSYVVNHDTDWCSEFGSIQVKPVGGGLVRVA